MNPIGELESEIKILDLDEKDLESIDNKMQALGARKVADYTRHIMTLDNGTSSDLDQLLRITEEDGYTKVTLHINQSDEERKRHIKFHIPKHDKFLEFLKCRYNERLIVDTYARRISYELGEGENCIDFDIDCFPAIPAFMEIDTENIAKQGFTKESLIKELGLEDKRCVVLGTEAIHTLYGEDYFAVYKPKMILDYQNKKFINRDIKQK